LQYQASTDTWRFAEHQWDFVGDDTDGNVFENDVKCNNALTSDSYDGWIDLFGWGTGQKPTYTISKSDWIRYFESQGAVFLPVSYSRECDKVYKPKDKGSWGIKYWSANQRDEWFGPMLTGSQLQKFFGLPVRLVTNAY